MPLETGTLISDLDTLWPLPGDFVQEGDDHLRLIKTVLKATFPGSGGLGFTEVIAATETEINYLQGLSGNIQSQIDSISAASGIEIPSGSVMLFKQAAAPVGWTQIATDDNSMLRMVSGVGGGAGGTDTPINFDATHTHTTSAHTLTLNEIPSHSHQMRLRNGAHIDSISIAIGGSSGGARVMNSSLDVRNTELSGAGDPHDHGATSQFSATFAPRYVNIIQASKD